MGKGIIRVINTPMGGGASLVTSVTIGANTVVGPGVPGPISNPPGIEQTGTLQEIVNGQPTGTIYNFRQPYGTEMGFDVNIKVRFTVVSTAGGDVAVSLSMIDKGVILSLNGEAGSLLDRATKQPINFVQPNAAELGIKAPVAGTNQKGSVVAFERVIDPNTGNQIAVSLELIK